MDQLRSGSDVRLVSSSDLSPRRAESAASSRRASIVHRLSVPRVHSVQSCGDDPSDRVERKGGPTGEFHADLELALQLLSSCKQRMRGSLSNRPGGLSSGQLKRGHPSEQHLPTMASFDVRRTQNDNLDVQPSESFMGASGRKRRGLSFARPDSEQGSEDEFASQADVKMGLPDHHLGVQAADALYVLCVFGCCALGLAGATLELTASVRDILIAIVLCLQGCTILWTALRFFVQSRRGDWDVMYDMGHIRSHYRRTWLAFDVFFAVPLECCFLGWANRAFFGLQLRHVFRAARIVALSRSGNPLASARHHVYLLGLFALFGFISHAAAIGFGELEDRAYQESLYWTIITVTSVGYGDVVPDKHSQWNRLFAAFVSLIGIALVALLTALATSILTSTDALQQALSEKKRMLGSMMAHYRIPWHVQVEVISMFPAVLDAENEKGFRSLISDLPDYMVNRITGYAKAKSLADAVPCFADLAPEVVLDITPRLHHRFHQANTPIITAGDDGVDMFFLVRGITDVFVPLPDGSFLHVAELRSGSFFGEMALLGSGKRRATVVATVLCELLVLGKADFVELIEKHVALKELFQREVFFRQDDLLEVTNEAAKPDGPQRSARQRTALSGSNTPTGSSPSAADLAAPHMSRPADDGQPPIQLRVDPVGAGTNPLDVHGAASQSSSERPSGDSEQSHDDAHEPQEPERATGAVAPLE